MVIGRSAKYLSVEVQLLKRRDDGVIQKAFLSAKTCKKMMSKKEDVRGILAMLKIQPTSKNDAERGSDIILDDKKAITVRRFGYEGSTSYSVTLQTAKDGERQPGLAFHMTTDEWDALQDATLEIIQEVDNVSTTMYGDMERRIPLYKWSTINMDSGTVVESGTRWEFYRPDAETEGLEHVLNSEKVMIQYKNIEPPSRQRLYDTVHIFLLRNALHKARSEMCEGCKTDPPSPSQKDHMVGGGMGCLDDLIEVSDDIYHNVAMYVTPMAVASLFNTVVSVLNVTDTRENEVGMSAEDLKRIVLNGMDWECSEVEYICQKIINKMSTKETSVIIVAE